MLAIKKIFQRKGTQKDDSAARGADAPALALVASPAPVQSPARSALYLEDDINFQAGNELIYASKRHDFPAFQEILTTAFSDPTYLTTRGCRSLRLEPLFQKFAKEAFQAVKLFPEGSIATSNTAFAIKSFLTMISHIQQQKKSPLDTEVNLMLREVVRPGFSYNRDTITNEGHIFNSMAKEGNVNFFDNGDIRFIMRGHELEGKKVTSSSSSIVVYTIKNDNTPNVCSISVDYLAAGTQYTIIGLDGQYARCNINRDSLQRIFAEMKREADAEQEFLKRDGGYRKYVLDLADHFVPDEADRCYLHYSSSAPCAKALHAIKLSGANADHESYAEA